MAQAQLEQYKRLLEECHRLMDTLGEEGWYDAQTGRMDSLWRQMTAAEQDAANQHAVVLYEKRIQ